MTPEQATKLAAEILATWPGNRENLTTAIYIRHLLPLDHDLAEQTFLDLARNCDKLPPIAAILRQYENLYKRTRDAQPRLPWPEISDEDRAANLTRAYELLNRIGRDIPGEPS